MITNLQLEPIEGNRAAVLAVLESHHQLAQPWRDAITEAVNTLPEFTGSRVTASFQVIKGMVNVHITVTGKNLAG